MDVNLVVLDGSQTAQNAADLAVKLARAAQQKLFGLYVVDASLVLDPYASYQTELGRSDQAGSRTELTEWFEALGNRVLQEFVQMCAEAGILVETQIVFGGVSEIILERAANVQMLTLGRRGREQEQAPEPGNLGENFRHIAHHARIPLLVGGEIDNPIQHLLLLHDGSPNFGLALDWTVKLQRSLAAEVSVAVMDPGDSKSIEAEIQEQLAQHELSGYQLKLFLQDDISSVLSWADQSSADLLLVGSYHHPEILEWLVGGSIDRILRESHRPVLIG